MLEAVAVTGNLVAAVARKAMDLEAIRRAMINVMSLWIVGDGKNGTLLNCRYKYSQAINNTAP